MNSLENNKESSGINFDSNNNGPKFRSSKERVSAKIHKKIFKQKRYYVPQTRSSTKKQLKQ